MTAATTSRRVSQAELGRELGVSRQAVNDLVARGVLVLGADRKLDLDAARIVVQERVRPTGKTAAAVAASGAAPGVPTAAQPKGDNAAAYYVAKASREASEAGIAALRLAEMQGDLIKREPTVQATFTAFRQLRNTLTFLPRKLAGQLVGMTQPRDIQSVIETEIKQALDDFQKKTLASLVGRLGAAAEEQAE
jgi:hypothetical protein